MKRILTLTIAGAMLLASTTAVARVYTCTVGDRKVYQSTPCEAGDKPIEMYVPPAPKNRVEHGRNENLQEFLEQRDHDRKRADSIVDQRAREARNSRLQQDQADAEKLRIQRAITDNKVVVGMTAENVRDSWGRPDDINTGSSSNGQTEQWVYEKSNGGVDYVHFRNGKVSSVRRY